MYEIDQHKIHQHRQQSGGSHSYSSLGKGSLSPPRISPPCDCTEAIVAKLVLHTILHDIWLLLPSELEDRLVMVMNLYL